MTMFLLLRLFNLFLPIMSTV